jgi:hypothetical protein
MKEHGLLADINFSVKEPDQRKQTFVNLMRPLELHLQQCFERTKEEIESLEQNKNYFAMSLKMYFVELATEHEDLLELMCHNYVHQWVNKEVAAKPKVSSKYMIEEKLEHLKALKDKLSRKERQSANKG